MTSKMRDTTTAHASTIRSGHTRWRWPNIIDHTVVALDPVPDNGVVASIEGTEAKTSTSSPSPCGHLTAIPRGAKKHATARQDLSAQQLLDEEAVAESSVCIPRSHTLALDADIA